MSTGCSPKPRRPGPPSSNLPNTLEWGGYSGYFADLDGHLWEIAYNPQWTINDDGTITL